MTNPSALTGCDTFGISVVSFFFYFFWIVVSWLTSVESDPKAPFSIATTPMNRGGRYSIPLVNNYIWIFQIYKSTIDYKLPSSCYIIAERFFFILSFFVLYILPFGLVHGLVRCTHWMQVFTRSGGGGMWQSQIGNRTGDVNDVMPGSDGLRILEFKKKTVKWDSSLEKGSWFSELAEARPVVCSGSDGKVRIERNSLSLSLFMSKNLKL